MKNIICLASLLWISAAAVNYAVAENVSLEQQLEQAIYTEEVLGDLDKATQLYQRIISDGHQSRTLVANALLRLAQCQQKLGNSTAASETFSRIKRDYADIEQVINSVKLFEAAQAERKLSLKPVPWYDGETLEYATYDANDNVSYYETQIITPLLGKNGERQSKKEFIAMSTARKNGHYFSLVVDDISGDLVSSQMQSSYDKGVTFTAKDGKSIVHNKNNGLFTEAQRDDDAVDGAVFSEILRRLPYKVGYKEKLKVFNLNDLNHAEVIVEVIDDNVRINVPAGEFYTYHISTEWLFNGKSVSTQNIWISKDRNAKIIQSSAQNNTMKLLSIDAKTINETTEFQYKDKFKLTLPKQWIMFDMTLGNSKEMVLVPTPFDLRKLSAQITSRYEGNIDWKKESVDIVAKWSIDFSKSYFKHFVVREESRKNFKIEGLPAYSFIADFKNGDIDMIEYRIIVLGDPMVYQAYFQVNKDAFESVKPEIDELLNSLKIIKQ